MHRLLSRGIRLSDALGHGCPHLPAGWRLIRRDGAALEILHRALRHQAALQHRQSAPLPVQQHPAVRGVGADE